MSAPQTEGPSEASAVSSARGDLVSSGRTLLARGLLSQTSGNLSIRVSPDEVCITPSGMEYDRLEPADMALTGTDGTLREGRYAPSSETPLHCLVYDSRPDVSAIVHTHSPYATTLAILGATGQAEEVTRLRFALDTAEEDGPDLHFEPPVIETDAAESALVERKMRELGYL